MLLRENLPFEVERYAPNRRIIAVEQGIFKQMTTSSRGQGLKNVVAPISENAVPKNSSSLKNYVLKISRRRCPHRQWRRRHIPDSDANNSEKHRVWGA